MNIRFINKVAALLMCLSLCNCSVKYSLSGASIPISAKTVSVATFPNNATMVAPILSSTMTEALQTKFERQTRLDLVREGGDLAFEGEITNYTSTPASVTSNEVAATNRLSITVKVKFTNTKDSKLNYSRSFTQFLEYDSSSLLTTVEPTLIPEIVDMLVDDIFNAAVANW